MVIYEKTQLGEMSRYDALTKAKSKGLDLYVISPKAEPPVAKIFDYGKYKYEKQKKEREFKKTQKTIEIKEIRLSTFIDKHDMDIKAKRAVDFLGNGDNVKVSLRFKGRELGMVDKGRENMERFAEMLSEHSEMEKDKKLDGRVLHMTLKPIKKNKNKEKKEDDNGKNEN